MVQSRFASVARIVEEGAQSLKRISRIAGIMIRVILIGRRALDCTHFEVHLVEVSKYLQFAHKADGSVGSFNPFNIRENTNDYYQR